MVISKQLTVKKLMCSKTHDRIQCKHNRDVNDTCENKDLRKNVHLES